MSSSESDDEPIAYDNDDQEERTAIRSQLSSLSFEELQKLKEKIGAKVYKEALFGKNDKIKESSLPKVFKRENKNRPREMSSKRPVRIKQSVPVIKKDIRDPRFDPLCGEFDKKQFSENYGFLTEFRMKDIKATREELKQTVDPEKQKQLKRLLQRLNDQHKSTKKSKVDRDEIIKEKQQVEQEFREGKMPHFKNKSELRVESLVKQYEELKKQGAGRIQRHLQRRQQKVKKRSHKAPTGDS